MKKKGIFLFVLLFLMSFAINVKAESAMYFGNSLSFNEEEVWVASGKKMDFSVSGSTSEISFGVGEEAALVSKERVKSLKIEISNSSGVNCTLSNLKSSYYSMSGNTFTLIDDNTPTSNLNSNDGKIAGISCTLPTTSDVLNYSKNNYITIKVTTTDIDVAPETPTTKTSSETYKYTFGVINESYLQSLNDATSITSVTVDGNSSSSNMIEVNKDKVTLNLTQNNLASKNKVYLNLHSDKKGDVIKKMVITAGEKSIDLPYGASVIEVMEETEKAQVLDRLFDNVSGTHGFSNSSVNYNRSAYFHFLYNRPDNRSKVNTLKSLMVTNATISFKPDLKNYIITVPYKVSSVTINSMLTDPKSTYVKGYGNRTVSLKEGLNTVLVKVKAENETEATYTLKITREKNDDASLKSITVDDKVIDVKDGLLIYSTKVKNEVVKPTVKATPTDSNAKVAIEKITELKEGSNEINITVTASNGNKSIYVIDIIRDLLISTDSTLKNLEVKGQKIDFASDKTEYKVHITHDIDKLDLVVEPEHEKATYLVTGNKDLENGSIVKVKVTAEDGKTITTYTINVEKDKKPFNILYVVIPGVIILIGVAVLVIKKLKKTSKPVTEVTDTKEEKIKEESKPTEEKVDEVEPDKSE